MAPPSLAALLAGADVDGCDLDSEPGDGALARAGIAVADGHDPRHVADRHLVVTTMARPDLAEVAAAERAGRLHHRTDLLAAVLRGRTVVAVTGTHGKGTVAALVGCALEARRADPLVLLGVPAAVLGGMFRGGAGPAVVEADDADGTIARVPADVSVVTNSWFDHPMLGRTRLEVIHDVSRHVTNVPGEGRVILGRGRALTDVARAARAPVWRLGRDFEVEVISADDAGRVLRFHDPVGGPAVTGRIRLQGGNVADNAALAFAALRSLGVSPEEAAASLGALDTLQRRLEFVGEACGVRVFDDLGKHPEAIAANLRALRELHPRRVHVVYEPSQHADVLRWGRRWADVLGRADSCVVLPMNFRAALPVTRRAPPDWPARVGLSADLTQSRDDAVARVAGRCRAGDTVLVCGMADDLATVARRLVERLDA